MIFCRFFLPGVLAAFIVFQVLPSHAMVFRSMGDVVDGLIFSIIALSLGLGIHRITFLFMKNSWYKKLIFPTIAKLVVTEDEDITMFFDKANKAYNPEKLNAGGLFDEAYYFLEYNDKIASAKAFQAIYFFLRNTFTLGLLLLPLMPILAFFEVFFDNWPHCLYYTLATFALLFILSRLAVFYRLKMVERIFNTFYIAMKHQEKAK